MLQYMYNFTLKMDLLIYYIYRIWLYILRKMVLIIKECYILKTNMGNSPITDHLLIPTPSRISVTIRDIKK